MRKLFWTCTMCSVMLAGAVISTAHFAVHHPQSAIGRVLNGASYAAAFINPVSGLGSVASHVRADDPAEENDAAGLADPVPADPEAVPEDPVPVTTDDQAGVKSVESGPIVAASTGAAPIVIAEEGHTVPPYEPAPKDVDVPLSTTSVEYAIPINLTEIECPAVVEATAPRAMPYCEEEQECELLPMPTEESELLPMPTEEPEMLPMPHMDEEENGCPRQVSADELCQQAMIAWRAGQNTKAIHLFEQVSVKAASSNPYLANVAQKWVHYLKHGHQAYGTSDVKTIDAKCGDDGVVKTIDAKCADNCLPPTAPYPPTLPPSSFLPIINEPTPKCDGPCHHKGCCPHTDKACPATPRGEEEPSEAAHTSVRRKLSIFHIYDCDDACPKHPDVDTMEYRSSDRHLYDYGPGSL